MLRQFPLAEEIHWDPHGGKNLKDYRANALLSFVLKPFGSGKLLDLSLSVEGNSPVSIISVSRHQ
jgi:hypothetical protein